MMAPMSRGFDLIRRHLVGRKSAGHEQGTPPADPAGADVSAVALVPEVDPAGDYAPPTTAPPPFDPVRVASTPPPPRPERPKPVHPRPEHQKPKPRNLLPREPANTAGTPSETLQHTQLPEILRPRGDAERGPEPGADMPAPPPNADAVRDPRPEAKPPAGPEQTTPDAGREPRPNPVPDRAAARQADASVNPRPMEPPRQRAGIRRPSTKRIDRTNARAARRHSVFVALMKGLLPSLVLGLIGVFFFYSYDFQPIALPGNVKFDPGKVSISTEGIRMVAPKLTGVDDKQQTFEIKADAAIQDRADPAKVTLEGIDARVNLADGGTIGFSAQKGVYNTDLNQIWLEDDLEIRSSEGYVAQLSEAQVDFKNGLMVSNNPVLIFTNDGVISAKGIQVLDGGNKVIFTGGVTLNLNGSAGETQ